MESKYQVLMEVFKDPQHFKMLLISSRNKLLCEGASNELIDILETFAKLD